MSREKAQSSPVGNELGLVRRSQRGDQAAFAQLYDAYIDRIHRYIYFRVAEDDEMAEDITSQVFLKAWEKLDSYQPGQSPFIAWLYRIAHNAVIDYYRTNKIAIALDEARPVEISHEDGTEEKLDLQFESQQLRAALQELTEDQQQVLILKFINGFSTPEIAQQLGKQQGAVRALQMRALQGLAKSLGVDTEQVYDN
jgi:RNA polymerase sigma-70 factor (ECF subfamily)